MSSFVDYVSLYFNFRIFKLILIFNFSKEILKIINYAHENNHNKYNIMSASSALYLKTALVGDSSIGKTSLMVKYVELVRILPF